MITPSAEEVEARRRGIMRRVPWVVLLVLLMAASIFAPTIGVRVATEFGALAVPSERLLPCRGGRWAGLRCGD